MAERLVTRPERNAQQRMDAFVGHARDECAAFGSNLDWDRPDWDVTAHCQRPVAKAAQKGVLYYTTHENGTAKTIEGRVPMAEPFASFIKALIRRRQETRPQGDAPLSRIINAARDLHDLLADRAYDPVRLIHADFLAAAVLANGRSSPLTAYRLGCALQIIADTIDRHGLSAARIDWRNPLKRQNNALSRTSKHAEDARETKLPSPEVLDELARLSHLVTDPSDVVCMGVIKLLHCAPWRIGEVLALHEDCEVEEQKIDETGPVFDQAGEPVMRYGVRYWKEKSADADIKWIPTVMVDVARGAIADIRCHTKTARDLARWLEDYPGRAWLPGPDLGPSQTYSIVEIAEMFGMEGRFGSGRQWLLGKGVAAEGSGVLIARADLEAALLKDMLRVREDRRGMKLSDHLFLVHRNFHHNNKATNPCLLSLTRDQHIADFLSGRASSRGRTLSVFEKFDSPPAADATPMAMNSHQFRHWLNTLAHAGGLDQALVARWSGRDDLQQNGEYDHLTGMELADRFRGMMDDGKVQGALADVHARKEPADRETFRDTVIATAHVTDIGLCDLDWISSTCPEFQACETCEFCVVEKGERTARERTERRLEDNRWLLHRVEAEERDGTYGASNHAHGLRQSIKGCERILAIHDDPAIADGTLVQPTTSSPRHFAGPGLEDAA